MGGEVLPLYIGLDEKWATPVSISPHPFPSGSELHFPSVQPSDAGVYICTCRSLHHVNTSRAELLVTGESLQKQPQEGGMSRFGLPKKQSQIRNRVRVIQGRLQKQEGESIQ